MTFQQIYTELTDLRFNTQATKLAEVKRWVNQAEIKIWNSADWAFKRVPGVAMTVTAGAATEPADFGKANRLYDPRGDEVPYMLPDEFEENYIAPVPVPTGNAEAYTVIDRQIIVGPGETGSFRLSYTRRYTKRNSGGAATQGVMSADLDTPYWDSEHHYVLVPWALILGEKLEADPTAEFLRSERDELLDAMKQELISTVDHQIMVWGGGATVGGWGNP